MSASVAASVVGLTVGVNALAGNPLGLGGGGGGGGGGEATDSFCAPGVGIPIIQEIIVLQFCVRTLL